MSETGLEKIGAALAWSVWFLVYGGLAFLLIGQP